jgi:hypothetical protein
MNREQTADVIKVMEHYRDGGEVEAKRLAAGDAGRWEDYDSVNSGVSWNWAEYDYRIKKRSGEGLAEIWKDGSMTVHAFGYARASAKCIKIKWEECD